MTPAVDAETMPPRKPGINSYRPRDIKRWGVKRFLEEKEKRGPFIMPDFEFTEEENRLMDELIDQERQATADGL